MLKSWKTQAIRDSAFYPPGRYQIPKANLDKCEDEYIFDLEKAVVVETPQLGHATYVFAKPRSVESFLANYTKITKDDIRNNRDNIAEQLKFLGRVIHGTNPKAWLKEVRQRVGEKMDHAAPTAE